MKIFNNKLRFSSLLLLTGIMAFGPDAVAGNKDRIGAAGGTQLMINPWARSSGLAGANSVSAIGIESTAFNVAGLAFTKQTELNFVSTSWLGNTQLNALGFAQRTSESSVFGINVQSYSFGDIKETMVDNPENGGFFNVQYMNLGFSYAREFSNSIYSGFQVKVLSEGISNARSSAIVFDAGIRYITGERDNIKFGIALRNVGGKMQFEGDGFSTKVNLDDKEFTLEQRTEPFSLPSTLNIGFTYDGYVGEEIDMAGKTYAAAHRVSGSMTFQSNSFGKDQFRVGVEYAFQEKFMVRGGYLIEEGNSDDFSWTNAFPGLTAGASISWPYNDEGSTIELDYSYRVARTFSSVSALGLRINL